MPSPGPRGTSEQDLTLFVNDLNATWIRATERFSPGVLADLYAHASDGLAAFIETLAPHAGAVLPVSWAGQAASPQWLDIGREFAEVWHHGSQIREAVGAGPFRHPSWLGDVLRISMHALPHAWRGVQPPGEDASVVIEVTGRAPGTWTLRRAGHAWDIDEGGSATPAATIAMSDETAWRLLFNALSRDAAAASIALGGNIDLARPILDLAKQMLTEDIELFPGARETLATLAASWPLMLITKGDLLHQRSKLERSGLGGCFRYVEIVSHKTTDVYTSILARHGIPADRFLMVGNSLRSDILTVVEAGGWAVHVPAAGSWAHEGADAPPPVHGRYVAVPAPDPAPGGVGTR